MTVHLDGLAVELDQVEDLDQLGGRPIGADQLGDSAGVSDMPLTFAFDPDGNADPVGLMQAWASVDAMYRKRFDALIVCLDFTVPETVQASWPTGIGSFDGGIAVVKSGNDVFCWIGPGSGKFDYAAWAVFAVRGTGVFASASSDAQAWINTLWSGYLIDLKGQVSAAINAALGPGGRVQLVGFSLGAAMAMLLGRALASTAGVTVDVVGFGTPRPIANSAALLPGALRIFRVTALNDPVDLVPPTYHLSLMGGTVQSLPLPTAWDNVGLRFVMDAAGNLSAQVDPPSPSLDEFLALLAQNILLHLASNYTDSISPFYARRRRADNEAPGQANWQNMALAIDNSQPFHEGYVYIEDELTLFQRVARQQAQRVYPTDLRVLSNEESMPPVWGIDP